MLAWIGEKLESWTDGKGNVLNVLSKDEIITNVMIYWVTGTIHSSMRLYYEYVPLPTTKGVAQPLDGYVPVPTGIASFPNEIISAPRSWLAHSFNVVHYSVFAEGGHFSAWEQPDLFLQDVRAFAFRSTNFDKCCKLHDERRLLREERARSVAASPQTLASRLLLLSPVLPVPVVAGVAAYLLASKI